jgi:hypothetical protein
MRGGGHNEMLLNNEGIPEQNRSGSVQNHAFTMLPLVKSPSILNALLTNVVFLRQNCGKARHAAKPVPR